MDTEAAILVAVLFAGALAGCIGETPSGAEEDEAVETTQTEANGSSAELQPADVHVTHDFTEGSDEVTIEVPEGTVAEVHHVFIAHHETASEGVCLFPTEAQVLLEDPSGEAAFSASTSGISYASGDGTCGSDHHVSEPPVRIEPGTWTATFEGRGLGTGHVVLQG